MSSEVRSWRLHRHTTLTPAELARWIDPIVRGWMRLLRAVLPLSAIRCWAALTITWRG